MRREASTPYSAKAVANYFLDRARSHGEPLDPMKLLKLIYFAHGWHLAVYDRPLIDEQVEAWQYGPVIPSVYHEFKRFGRLPIQGAAYEFDGQAFFEPRIPPTDREAVELLERIWTTHGGLSGLQLSSLSHEEGSPWAETWRAAQERGKRRGVDISDDLIRRYFVEEARRSRKAG